MIQNQEEVLRWFQCIDSSIRIDFVCQMLTMCNPTELRFFGTFIEQLGQRDYNVLHEQEMKANDPEVMKTLRDPFNQQERSKMVIYLCLLHSHQKNRLCATVLFEVLSQIDEKLARFSGITPIDADVVSDLHLLFTLAIHHPIFSCNQKQEFMNIRESFCDQYGSPPASSPNVRDVHSQTHSAAEQSREKSASTREALPDLKSNLPGHIRSLAVLSKENANHDIWFTIEVRTTDGAKMEIKKSWLEVRQFHQRLLRSFPEDTKAKKAERKIPLMLIHTNDHNKAVCNYLRELCKMPAQYLNSETVLNFFQSSTPVLVSTNSSSSSLSGSKSQTTVQSHNRKVEPENKLLEPNRGPPSPQQPNSQPQLPVRSISLQSLPTSTSITCDVITSLSNQGQLPAGTSPRQSQSLHKAVPSTTAKSQADINRKLDSKHQKQNKGSVSGRRGSVSEGFQDRSSQPSTNGNDLTLRTTNSPGGVGNEQLPRHTSREKDNQRVSPAQPDVKAASVAVESPRERQPAIYQSWSNSNRGPHKSESSSSDLSSPCSSPAVKDNKMPQPRGRDSEPFIPYSPRLNLPPRLQIKRIQGADNRSKTSRPNHPSTILPFAKEPTAIRPVVEPHTTFQLSITTSANIEDQTSPAVSPQTHDQNVHSCGVAVHSMLKPAVASPSKITNSEILHVTSMELKGSTSETCAGGNEAALRVPPNTPRSSQSTSSIQSQPSASITADEVGVASLDVNALPQRTCHNSLDRRWKNQSQIAGTFQSQSNPTINSSNNKSKLVSNHTHHVQPNTAIAGQPSRYPIVCPPQTAPPMMSNNLRKPSVSEPNKIEPIPRELSMDRDVSMVAGRPLVRADPQIMMSRSIPETASYLMQEEDGSIMSEYGYAPPFIYGMQYPMDIDVFNHPPPNGVKPLPYHHDNGEPYLCQNMDCPTCYLPINGYVYPNSTAPANRPSGPPQNGYYHNQYAGGQGFVPTTNSLISPGLPNFTRGAAPQFYPSYSPVPPNPHYSAAHGIYPIYPGSAPYSYKKQMCAHCGSQQHAITECAELSDHHSTNSQQYQLDLKPKPDNSE